MTERVHGTGKTALLFQLVPMIPHRALITLGTVKRAEDPVRVEVHLFVPANSFSEDSVCELSDRNDPACIRVLSFCDLAFCVDCASDRHSVMRKVRDLQAESFARSHTCEKQEAEERMIPELGGLE